MNALAAWVGALLHNQLFLLFATVGVGYLLSHLKFRGVNFGVATVLFVGLAIGAISGGSLQLPEVVSQLGLLLFVYTIGLQAAPAFFPGLRRRGLPMLALACGAVGTAGLFTWAVAALLRLDPALAVGLFCGATTNTPALAAVTDTLAHSAGRLLPAVGYSVAYPLGVLVPLLAADFIARVGKVDIAAETRKAERGLDGVPRQATARNLLVLSPAIAGKTVHDSPLADLGVRISRVQHGQNVELATPDAVMHMGDVVHVVGSREQLREAEKLVGPEVHMPGPETRRDQVEMRKVFLSNPELAGRLLGDVEPTIEQDWEAMVTRIRRGDLEFVPTADTRLERGDQLRIVARADHMDLAARHFGDSFRAINETDFLSLSLGVLLGLALGMIRIPLPGGVHLQLGLAGGPLLVALLVGWLGRTGPIIWTLPLTTNLGFRQFGLVLFFAAVGLRSGSHFITALATQGPALIVAGAAVTLAATAVLLIGSFAVLRFDWVTGVGTLAGGQTQPALLSFVGERARSEAPNAAYVAIMPIAMVAKILAAQLLLFWMR